MIRFIDLSFSVAHTKVIKTCIISFYFNTIYYHNRILPVLAQPVSQVLVSFVTHFIFLHREGVNLYSEGVNLHSEGVNLHRDGVNLH